MGTDEKEEPIMITFNKWTHPATGEVRVYVNQLPGAASAKIYLMPGAVRVDGLNSIDFVLGEGDGGELVMTFKRVFELAR